MGLCYILYFCMIKTCILQTKQLAKRFKMIQLLTRDNQIIYEVEKSEHFNDYCSVLRKLLLLMLIYQIYILTLKTLMI